MELFINSTYAQSMRGFRLMRLFSDDRFYDVQSPDEMGEELFAFFSEDLFRAFWFDRGGVPGDERPRSYLGIKGVRGMFNNGKPGVIDIAVLFSDGETAAAPFVANVVLNSYYAFSALLFSKVTVDVNGDYSFDFEGFAQAFDEFEVGENPKFVNQDDVCNVLRTAILIGSPERAIEQLRRYGLNIERKYITDDKRFERFLTK